MKTKQIDWTNEEKKARFLSDDAIAGMLTGLINGLEAADDMDRVEGGDRGGYYRDLCSVLRAEQLRRKNDKAQQLKDKQLKLGARVLEIRKEALRLADELESPDSDHHTILDTIELLRSLGKE